MKSLTYWFSVFVLVALLTSCGAPQPRPEEVPPQAGYSDKVPKDAEALWQKAEEALKAGNTAAGVNSLDRIIQNYPNNAVAARALHRAGVVYLDQGQPDRALQYFDYLLYFYPSWSGVNRAKLDRLRALSMTSRRKEVEKAAMPLWDATASEPDVRLRLAGMMVGYFASARDVETAFNWATAGFAVAGTPEANRELAKATLDMLKDANESTLRRLYKKAPSDFMKVFLDYRLSQIEMEQGQQDAARDRLKALLAQNPSHPAVPEIQAALRGTPVAAESGLPVNPDRIGCLLPLNGPYSKYGEVVMKGLNVASSEWNERHPSQPITLVMKDSQADPALASGSFEELARQDGVLAVIGPWGHSPPLPWPRLPTAWASPCSPSPRGRTRRRITPTC